MAYKNRLTLDTSVIKNKDLLNSLFDKEFREYRIILTTLIIREIAKEAKEDDDDGYIARNFLKMAIHMEKEIGLVDLDEYEDKFACVDEAIIQYCKETGVSLITSDVYMYLIAQAKGVKDVLIYKENINDVLPDIYIDSSGKARIVCGFDNGKYIEVYTPLKERISFGNFSLSPQCNIFSVSKIPNGFKLIHYKMNDRETVEVVQKYTFILDVD